MCVSNGQSGILRNIDRHHFGCEPTRESVVFGPVVKPYFKIIGTCQTQRSHVVSPKSKLGQGARAPRAAPARFAMPIPIVAGSTPRAGVPWIVLSLEGSVK
eukprot:scaffold6362_cov378-Prasinococcus_capsulatus_cf.AAC.8